MADWECVEKKNIQAEEQCRLIAYRDSLGFWTVGWGHHDSTIGESTTWAQEHADEIFDEDFEDAVSAAQKLCASFSSLSDSRKGVLAAMSFQLGAQSMAKFVGMLQAIDEDDFVTAARHMRQSLWAKQTPLRVQRLAKRMETGLY